jgi:tetratricopeptide (TPR) repeat protein
MPVDLKGYRIFIASPSGLDEERKAFCGTIEEYNRCDSIARNVQFIPIGWEETLGGVRRPQGIINDEVRKCDYFVMILYDRWGTSPGQNGNKKYSSGTEEEYHVAMECFKDTKFPMRQIVIFFKSVDERRLSDPGEQLQKVLDFRKKLESEKTHLFHVCDTVNSFTIWLRRYLAQWVRDDESGNTAKIKHPVAPYDETAAKAKDISKLEPPEKISEPLEDKFEGLLKKAEELADNGKITEAEITYSEAVVRSNSPVVINAYGNFLSRLGRLGQAEVMHKRVMEISQNIKDKELESIACGNLGLIYQTRGDLVKAEEMLNKALEIDKKISDQEGMARDYGNLGVIYGIRGDLDKAEKMFNKILEIHKKLDNQEGMARDYGNLGLIYKTRGDLNKAEEMYKKSLEISEAKGMMESTSNQYGNLGVIYIMRGDLDKAEEMHKKALEIDERMNNQVGMADDYGNLGVVYITRGELDKAEEMHKKTLEINEKIGRLEGMGGVYSNLGLIYKERGDLDKAEEMHRRALEVHEKLGCLEGMANNYGNLGIVYKNRGDLEKARQHWVKARDLYAKIGMPHMVKKVQRWINETEKKVEKKREKKNL